MISLKNVSLNSILLSNRTGSSGRLGFHQNSVRSAIAEWRLADDRGRNSRVYSFKLPLFVALEHGGEFGVDLTATNRARGTVYLPPAGQGADPLRPKEESPHSSLGQL